MIVQQLLGIGCNIVNGTAQNSGERRGPIRGGKFKQGFAILDRAGLLSGFHILLLFCNLSFDVGCLWEATEPSSFIPAGRCGCTALAAVVISTVFARLSCASAASSSASLTPWSPTITR